MCRYVLAAHYLDDGCEDGHAHQDVDGAHQHVAGLVPAHEVCAVSFQLSIFKIAVDTASFFHNL